MATYTKVEKPIAENVNDAKLMNLLTNSTIRSIETVVPCVLFVKLLEDNHLMYEEVWSTVMMAYTVTDISTSITDSSSILRDKSFTT